MQVAKVQDYGAFVEMEGFRKQGLVHVTQVSNHKTDSIAEVLEKGDRVWVKVVSIQDDGKISMSMKYVDQGSGKDLDSNQVRWDQESKRGKKLVVQQSIDPNLLNDPLSAMQQSCKPDFRFPFFLSF